MVERLLADVVKKQHGVCGSCYISCMYMCTRYIMNVQKNIIYIIIMYFHFFSILILYLRIVSLCFISFVFK